MERTLKEYKKEYRAIRIKWVIYLKEVVNEILDYIRDNSDEDSIVYKIKYKIDWEKEISLKKLRRPLIKLS